MRKYISPTYYSEKVETADVICTSGGFVMSEATATDKEGNVIMENGVPVTKSVAEISFSQIFGN